MVILPPVRSRHAAKVKKIIKPKQTAEQQVADEANRKALNPLASANDIGQPIRN